MNNNKATGSNIPMSFPELMLACHKHKGGHSVTWIKLEDGRILRTGDGFRYSEDGGITWSKPFVPKDKNGDLRTGTASLVQLARRGIGMVTVIKNGTGPEFRRSEDNGLTWSGPVRIADEGIKVKALHDVLSRTSSGRIIFPCYVSIGQGNFHRKDAPFPGGYVQGNFVSTDAHFYDPHFGAAIVYYSDDEGETWQRNRDGEMFIILPETTTFEPVYEPSLTEVSPGKLLMMMRTRLGRYFQSWSYDNGETWTRPCPTQLAGCHVPCQIRTLPETGDLLCVFTQHSEEEVKSGFIRQRLSSAISRNGGGVWEHFQNVESILEETHVEPGPIHFTKPEQCYSMGETSAPENDPRYCKPLPENYGRWSYPSVLVLEDRVLISHSQNSWRKDAGIAGEEEKSYNALLKVLPISWFYGGGDPLRRNPTLEKLTKLAPQP